MAQAQLLFNSSGTKSCQMTIKAFCEDVLANRPRFEASKVVKMVHYKRPGQVEHEFLVLYVEHSGREHTLRLERGRDKSGRMWDLSFSRVAATDNISRCQILGPSAENPRNHNEAPGRDDPLYLGADSKKFQVLEISILRGKDTLALPDLCLILQFVPELEPNYNVKRSQCYWFCWAILETVAEELDTEPTPGRDYARGGKWGPNVVVLDHEDAKRRLKEAYEKSEQREEGGLRKAVAMTFRAAATTNNPVAEGSQANKLSSLFRYHHKQREETERQRREDLQRAADGVRDKVDWDSNVERMTPVSRTFATIAREGGGGLKSAAPSNRMASGSWAM